MKIPIAAIILISNVISKSFKSDSTILENKIIGGIPVHSQNVTYMVSLKHIFCDHFCGGTLISSLHVLTAAHCLLYVQTVTYYKYGGMHVVLGTHNISEAGISIEVEHLDVHDSLADFPLTPINDIGLITLAQYVSLSDHISVLELPKCDVELDTEAMILGWGSTTFVAINQVAHASEVLRMLKVTVVNEQLCRDAYSHFDIDEHTICIRGLYQNETITKGDSGGPVVQNSMIIGIASYGNVDDKVAEKPSVFIKVYKHLDYIERAKKRAVQNLQYHKQKITSLCRIF